MIKVQQTFSNMSWIPKSVQTIPGMTAPVSVPSTNVVHSVIENEPEASL